MSYKIVNKQKLIPEIHRTFMPYLEKMLDIHQTHICSIFLYGSATGKNYVPKKSDINSVFIFKALPFSNLKKSLKLISSGIQKKISAPLFLTKNYIETSLDVFPIEFLDMKENHLLLYGEDILSSLTIEAQHLRLFCEGQIKGKMIRIRQAFLEVGMKNKGIELLLKESLYSLIPVFRSLLRLKGKIPPVEKEAILIDLCAAYTLEEEVFLPIHKDSSNDEKINNKDVIIFLEKYLDELEKLSIGVDKL